MNYAHIIGFLDMFCGVTLLWTMQKMTTRAGFATVEARWALMRRVVYAAMAFSLFGLGSLRLSDTECCGPTEGALGFALQLTFLTGVMYFPILRSLGLATRDMFMRSDDGPPLTLP